MVKAAAERVLAGRQRRSARTARRIKRAGATSCSRTSRARLLNFSGFLETGRPPEMGDEDERAGDLTSRSLLRLRPGDARGVNCCGPGVQAVGTPYFVARGEGAYVTDVEGNRYIDYVQSYGASILGHAHPKVVEAIQRAAGRGDDVWGAHPSRGPAR